MSYALGFNIVSAMSTKKFKQASHIISFGAMLTAGILMVVAADWSLQQDFAVGVAFGVSALLTALLIYYKKSINFIIFTVALVSVLIGCIFTL